VPDLVAQASALCAGGGAAHFDAAGARWVFPALRAEAEPRAAARRGPQIELAAAREAAAALARRRAAAATERERRFGVPLSALAHEAALAAWREGAAAGEGGEPAPAAPRAGARELATAVGTAVHRALERLDLAGKLAPALARERARLADELVRELAAEARAAALARAGELLERFAAGALGARFAELAPCVVARELPVLLPPQAGAPDSPAGYLAGAIDLVYRDPATGELVVADYKTDRVRGEAELAEKAARYALQGAGYVRALEQALGLGAPPRFELWFLDADRIVDASALLPGHPPPPV
jgi:ATP-dependent exoDNAse (exonuclease V) beta subunit